MAWRRTLVKAKQQAIISIPLIDLRAQYATIKDQMDAAVSRVIASGEYIMGPQVAQLEQEMAAYCQTTYALGVASGTDALHLALRAGGVGPGDRVITTPFTFAATVEAIIHCGATPVFADIEPSTFNLDLRHVEELITKGTRAIIPVHLYGHPVDMDPLLDMAKAYNLRVIEDCAQALGAQYKGKPVGSLGDIGCLSFFPTKNLGAYGDGGMVLTSDLDLAQRMDRLRMHGASHKYYHVDVGFNSRLDTIQAAVLLQKLPHLDSWVSQRRQLAAFYDHLLCDVPGIQPPVAQSYADHAFNYYTVRVTGPGLDRGRLRQYLGAQGIATAVYYPLSLHLQPAFRQLGYQQGDLPEAERAQEEVLCLPLYPELDNHSQELLVEAIRQHVHSSRSTGTQPH